MDKMCTLSESWREVSAGPYRDNFALRATNENSAPLQVYKLNSDAENPVYTNTEVNHFKTISLSVWTEVKNL